MSKKYFQSIKHTFFRFVNSRPAVLLAVFSLFSCILISRVFYLQIVKGQEYLDDYTLLIQKTRETQGTRGRILDRNGKVLADNRLAYAVTIEDNGEYKTKKEKNEIINDTISRVIEILERNGDSVVSNFKIIIGPTGQYEYTMEEGTSRYRFIADVYGLARIDDLTPEQKFASADTIMGYLCSDPTYGYGLDQEAMSKEDILKMVNVRYAMSLNRFQKYLTTPIANDISEATMAAISENIDSFQGINIEEDSIRVYPEGKCFSNIIGYTGQISTDEYDEMDEADQKLYSLTDIIGKAGLEQTVDKTLQGTKGKSIIYTNSVGKVIETNLIKEATTGNDVYLTIDKDLQEMCYNLLEEKIAGIVLANMRNVMNYDRSGLAEGSDAIIPADDVYYAFFGNEIIKPSHFTDAEAGPAEKAVYKVYSERKEEVVKELMANLKSSASPAYKDENNEMKAYLSYIASNMLTSAQKVILASEINTKDEVYTSWEVNEDINLNVYLNHLISKGWVDNTKLASYMNDESYTDSEELYHAMLNLIEEHLRSDRDFDKLVYKYLIKTKRITGKEVCMILYEQNYLVSDTKNYDRLKSGDLNPYTFVRSKIQALEITPGELGLEPCTGSLVVTDTKTGEVLACVSYPGYDNNRLANNMDRSYYSQLLHSTSAPLYNNATQERTAPGSTFKPLMAVAGLSEGIVDAGTTVKCNGKFEEVFPNPKCWVYPKRHNTMDVVTAIENSCNIYFYDMGYRMGLTTRTNDDGTTVEEYSTDAGMKYIQKWADQFGLSEPTGIEIAESDPQVSDSDSVRSAIGQGTNNYTTISLARYVNAIANKGTVYNMSLLNYTATVDGKVLEDFQPTIRNQIESVSGNTWNLVQKGMRAVVLHSARTYKSLGDFEMSGKTGTAQQSKTHADHGLYIGYAPSSAPEISFAVRIKNGYESSYVAEIGRDVVRYYFNLAEKDELVSGGAAEVQSSGTHGD